MREIADPLIEIRDHGIERLSGNRQSQRPGDGFSMFIKLSKVWMLQVVADFSFAQFVFTARFGDKRKMRVLRQRVSEALRDEYLSRRIGKMLGRADHVSD